MKRKQAENSAAEQAADGQKNGFDPEKEYVNLPLVVIAGRPNVGKSTLFNRLMHRRIAITDPTPGVTRDPIEGTTFIAGMPVHLMDTGGFKLTRDGREGKSQGASQRRVHKISTDELDDKVVAKTVEMLGKADLVLLLLDAGETTPEDEEFVALLRPHWHKVIAAVNKTEGGRNEAEAWNYARFGFDDMVFISAEHGDNITLLARKIVSRLDFSKVREGAADAPPIRIAVLGKPNTGKSTLTNRLTHTDSSIVSDYAGTTRDVVEGTFRYNGRDCVILDTAGIRRKTKVKESVEYYSVNRAIKTLDECDVVFLMIDALEGLAEQDKKICALAYERGRPTIFILNKWDTQEKGRAAARKAEEDIRAAFGQMAFAPIVETSALNGDGMKRLMDTALELYEQANRRIETSALNSALRDWLERYPPPASRTMHFKIRYITQTGTSPVSFVIFATRPESVPQTYTTFLKNRIREDLGLDKIPVQLEFKASRKKWEERE